MTYPIRRTRLRRGDRVKLERIVRSHTTPQRVVERAKIVLASASGISGNQICDEGSLPADRHSVVGPLRGGRRLRSSG